MLSTVQKIGPALDLFTINQPEWGTSEVAQALDTPKSSAHALLTTMADIGLLERTAQARYRLGWRLLVLGRTLLLSAEYRQVVAAALRRATERWGETMHFAVHERGCVVYVEKVEGRHSVPTPTRTGLRLPAHASGVGKVLLAHRPAGERTPNGALHRFTPQTIVDSEQLRAELERVRHKGIAVDREEAMHGLCCVAVPVFGRDGQPIGAISLSAARERFDRHESAYVRAVTDLGRRISRQLGGPAVDEARALTLATAA